MFSLYGAFAPVGFFAGIFFAGVSAQFTTWRWFFFIGAIILALVGVVAYFCVPNRSEDKHGKNIKMDWRGLVTVVPGLVLVIFALTDGSHAPQGWATPYIPATFILGCIFLCAFIYIEGWSPSNLFFLAICSMSRV